MPTHRGHRGTFTIGLVIPIQGPAGIFGPSCELCAQLAVEEANAGGGVLGRELRLLTVEGGASPVRVADEVDRLISAGRVHAIVGWHISAVREVLAPRIAQRVPYVYTALYEGGERRPGVFLTGETPQRQILPAMRWMAREIGVRRWCIVGNDYVWPRRSAAVSRGFARLCGAEVRDEIFVGLGAHDFRKAIGRLERSECEGVLMFLVGEDAVHFNRQFARAELDRRCVRLSPLMDENMLLATGPPTREGCSWRRVTSSACPLRRVSTSTPLYPAFRCGGSDAQQPRRIVLRGVAAAYRAGPAGSFLRRSADLRRGAGGPIWGVAR
jgi:urea transport system substrate-binding protein